MSISYHRYNAIGKFVITLQSACISGAPNCEFHGYVTNEIGSIPAFWTALANEIR